MREVNAAVALVRIEAAPARTRITEPSERSRRFRGTCARFTRYPEVGPAASPLTLVSVAVPVGGGRACARFARRRSRRADHFASTASSMSVGERPLHRDADAQPARPWRMCAGVIASGRPKSAGSGGHNALRARDAGAGSGANCRAPSRRPPGRGGCARRGGARIHDGEGAGRDGRREDGRVRPAFRSSRRSDPSILQNDVYR